MQKCSSPASMRSVYPPPLPIRPVWAHLVLSLHPLPQNTVLNWEDVTCRLSRESTVRGLALQHPYAQGFGVRCFRARLLPEFKFGTVFSVAAAAGIDPKSSVNDASRGARGTRGGWLDRCSNLLDLLPVASLSVHVLLENMPLSLVISY